MTGELFWGLFAETGDIEYYLLFKEESRKWRLNGDIGAADGTRPYENSDEIKTAV